jgi:hypothetical protein
MSFYYAVGLGRADLRNGELRNFSARRAKERDRFRSTSKFASQQAEKRHCRRGECDHRPVGEDDVIIGLFASVSFLSFLQQAKQLRLF